MKIKYRAQMSKLIFGILTMVLMTGIVSASEDDINNDDRITASDALLYLRHSVGQDISPFNIDL